MAQDVLNGDWELFSYDPLTQTKVETMDLGTHIAVKRTFLATDELLSANNEKQVDSIGKRWGDGQVAASIPLNLYFEKFAEARKNGDSKYIRKLLNDADYSKLRTFRGRL
jgi:hypothetical protein